MSCFENSYSLMNGEREMPYSPYGNTFYNYRQPPTPAMQSGAQPGPQFGGGMTPSMQLPSGIPTGPSYGGTPIPSVQPTTPMTPQTVQNPYYTAGYLRKFIGKDIRIEFLIGSGGPLVDRIGTLLEVGASYVTIRPIRSNDTLMCDLYAIKFVTIYGGGPTTY